MPGMPDMKLALDAIPNGQNFDKVVGFLDFHNAFGPEFTEAVNGEVSVEQAARQHDPGQRRRPDPGGALTRGPGRGEARSLVAGAGNGEATGRPGRPRTGGYAGDIVASGGGAWGRRGRCWAAWAACLDPEPDLLAHIRRDWPLREGVTPDAWRERVAAVPCTVSLARVRAGRPAEVRELWRGLAAPGGPSLACPPAGGQAPPGGSGAPGGGLDGPGGGRRPPLRLRRRRHRRGRGRGGERHAGPPGRRGRGGRGLGGLAAVAPSGRGRPGGAGGAPRAAQRCVSRRVRGLGAAGRPSRYRAKRPGPPPWPAGRTGPCGAPGTPGTARPTGSSCARRRPLGSGARRCASRPPTGATFTSPRTSPREPQGPGWCGAGASAGGTSTTASTTCAPSTRRWSAWSPGRLSRGARR